MYFLKFPLTLYTLDNGQSIQTIQDIFKRVTLTYSTKTKRSSYNLYDVVDGETPEIVSHKFYNSTMYHWIILHANEILDPRFDWVMTQVDLIKYVKLKYGEENMYKIHHYEAIVNGQRIMSPTQITGQEIEGRENDGGFTDGERIPTTPFTTFGYFYYKDPSQAQYNNFQMFYPISVSNFEHEDRLNEAKRRIKVIVPELVAPLTTEFSKVIKQNA